MNKDIENDLPERPYGKRSKAGVRLGRKPKNPPKQKSPPVIEKKTRKHRIDSDEMVRLSIMGLAKQGMTQDQIADTVGVSRSYLAKHFKQEIKVGKIIGDALVTENLYRQAMKDTPAAVPAAIYITKARMGWTDKHPDENAGRNQIVFDFSGLGLEERMALRMKLQQQVMQSKGDLIEGHAVDDDE